MKRGLQRGSIPFRMAEFFAANPDEELTLLDASTKFDASPGAVSDAVKQLRKAGLLESVHVIRPPAKGRMS